MIGAAATALGTGLARPAIAQASNKVLRFVPQANLANPDPVWTTTIVAANHAYMIWDQLWDFDDKLLPQPQMLAGSTVSDDKLTWRLTLRDGLLWHDGERVRPADCIASLTRWMKRDGMGQRIDGLLNEMRGIDDRSFDIVLKQPFPLLPMAFCNNCHMMPERMAKTDAFQQIKEYVGSGPFKFVTNEWVSGSLAVYQRNEKYVPRNEPCPATMAGGKRVYLDRVEWHVTGDPDDRGGGDPDRRDRLDSSSRWRTCWPVLRKAPGVKVDDVDLLGSIGIIRFNELQAPFNNQKLRQAMLAITSERDFLDAIMGNEKDAHRDHRDFHPGHAAGVGCRHRCADRAARPGEGEAAGGGVWL